MTDAVLSELRRLAADVRELRDEQQHLARRLLAADDRRALASLLPPAFELLGTAAWTAPDLAGAAVASRSEHADRLAAVIADYGGGGGLRAFGKLLARCEGVAAAGLRLVRVGPGDGSGIIYRLEHLPGFEGVQTRSDAGNASAGRSASAA